MYVGNKHTSVTSANKMLDYACDSCGFTSKVMVTGVGQGQGNSPYFMDETGAEKRALKHANKNAIENIDETFKIARCPKCNKRNETNVSAFWRKQIRKIVLGMLLFFGVGGLVYTLVDEGFVLIIFGVLALFLLPIMYYIDVGWRWKTADGRIQFIEE